MSAPFITVDVRSVYGKDTVYPADDAAKAFAAIAGTTSLTLPVLKHILWLGYEVRYVDRRPLAAYLVGAASGRAYCPMCKTYQPTIDDGETCGVCKLVLPGVPS
jgi:hypothetical protein